MKIASTVKIGGVKFKVTAIEKKAFCGCKKLTSVTIGKNIKTIGTETFKNCKKLKTITIKSKVLTKIEKNAIRNISKKAVIKVPSSKRAAYKRLFTRKYRISEKNKDTLGQGGFLSIHAARGCGFDQAAVIDDSVIVAKAS